MNIMKPPRWRNSRRHAAGNEWPSGPRFFLWIEGYNPRIHFVVFCPQLYKHDRDGRIVPLRGADIGQFIAYALNNKVMPRNPWYGLTGELPHQSLITESLIDEYDTVLGEPTLVPAMSRPALEKKSDTEKLERTGSV
jgi:hypothetical protein